MWGIIPAAGLGSRIQPLAFSKELLPVGSRIEDQHEQPRAVSEHLLERMIAAGATRLCFVIAPGKSDIVAYFGGSYESAAICYVVQPSPLGLCDSVFRAVPFIAPEEPVLLGLPDTVWFPENGLRLLDEAALSLLLFPVEHPELFDVVVAEPSGRVREIQVKPQAPRSRWIWGAMRMRGATLHQLYRLWRARGSEDAYLGTLINGYIAAGGEVTASCSGQAYVDVGTLHGYREAMALLEARRRLGVHGAAAPWPEPPALLRAEPGRSPRP